MCVATYPKQNLWSGHCLEETDPSSSLRASPSPLRTLLEDCSPNHTSPFQSHKILQGATQIQIKYSTKHAMRRPLPNTFTLVVLPHAFLWGSQRSLTGRGTGAIQDSEVVDGDIFPQSIPNHRLKDHLSLRMTIYTTRTCTVFPFLFYIHPGGLLSNYQESDKAELNVTTHTHLKSS